MRSEKIPLSVVSVASPCKAQWDAMVGDDKVRFCGQCARYVYNLSEMTRAEAETLISEHEGKMCVRFYKRADGTVMTKDCPVGRMVVLTRRARKIGKAVAGVFLAGFGFVSLFVFGASVRENGGVRLVNPIRPVMEWLFPPPELPQDLAAHPEQDGQVTMGVPCFPDVPQPAPPDEN